MVAGVRGQVAGVLVPPRGFEPLISTLKGWRPRPLDDGGTGRPEATRGSVRARSGTQGSGRRSRDEESDHGAGEEDGPDDGRDTAEDGEPDRPAVATDQAVPPDGPQRVR